MKKEKFLKKLNFYTLFWIFIAGSFLGVIIEMIFCFLVYHKFESRQGLIYGPFNLVYGVGALLLTVCLYKFERKNSLYSFFGGFFLGSAFEYLCSAVQEGLFGTVSWDYGDYPLNINGRVNLIHGLFWGLLTVFWIKSIYPWLIDKIVKFPEINGTIMTWFILAFMIFNTFISGAAVHRMTNRYKKIEAGNQFEAFLDEHYSDEFLNTIYPNMIYKSKN